MGIFLLMFNTVEPLTSTRYPGLYTTGFEQKQGINYATRHDWIIIWHAVLKKVVFQYMNEVAYFSFKSVQTKEPGKLFHVSTLHISDMHLMGRAFKYESVWD